MATKNQLKQPQPPLSLLTKSLSHSSLTETIKRSTDPKSFYFL